VLVVGLTWRDLASSAAIVAIILAYAGFQLRSQLPLLSSAWAASAVLLILSSCCAVTAAADLHTRPQSPLGVVFRRGTSVCGAVALIAGLIGVIAASRHALETLVVAMIVLWVTATYWHVLSIGADQ